MKGRIVLVTGASGGLGTYVTQAFLETGATVIGTSRKIQQSNFTSSGFTAMPGEISSRAGAQTIVDGVVARFGRLDVLAHTVGGFAGGQSVTDTDDATFQRMLDLNLNSVFHILRATIPVLRKSSGRIIAIGSRAAVEPGPARARTGCWRVQRIEGGDGVPDQDGRGRESRRRSDGKCSPAGDHGHTGESVGNARCRFRKMGAAGQCGEPHCLACE